MLTVRSATGSYGKPLGVSGNKYHLGIASLLSQGGAGSNPAAAAKKSLHRRQNRNTETTAGRYQNKWSKK